MKTKKESYYQSELNKISFIGDCSQTIQIRDSKGSTKWMNINKESAQDIVNFLTVNVLDVYKRKAPAKPKKDKLQKLAESLDFRTGDEYFQYCIDSYINGNFSQCKKLFNDLTKDGKKALMVFIHQSGNEVNIAACYKFYFNLF